MLLDPIFGEVSVFLANLSRIQRLLKMLCSPCALSVCTLLCNCLWFVIAMVQPDPMDPP